MKLTKEQIRLLERPKIARPLGSHLELNLGKLQAISSAARVLVWTRRLHEQRATGCQWARLAHSC